MAEKFDESIIEVFFSQSGAPVAPWRHPDGSLSTFRPGYEQRAPLLVSCQGAANLSAFFAHDGFQDMPRPSIVGCRFVVEERPKVPIVCAVLMGTMRRMIHEASISSAGSHYAPIAKEEFTTSLAFGVTARGETSAHFSATVMPSVLFSVPVRAFR